MENEACAEKVWDGDGDVEVEKVKEPPVVTVSPYRYSKVING
jgi:hypothetical protein